MKFTKAALAAAMLALTADGVQADTSAATTLTININNSLPSCDVSVPASYNLGILTPGIREHGDLNIRWDCKGNTPIKTALTADVVTGKRGVGNEKVYLVTNGSQATGAALSLREGKSFIKLTGSQAGDYFCSDTKNFHPQYIRSCTLTPVTNVSLNGPFGLASATLRFVVVYS